jgi:hypothetical protein
MKDWNKDQLYYGDIDMKRKIYSILKCAIFYKTTILVLGAFGCFMFKDRIDEVALIFKECLYDHIYPNHVNYINTDYDIKGRRYIDYFHDVVFSIPHRAGDNDVYDSFFKVFHSPGD